MSATLERKVVGYTRDRDFTMKELDALVAEFNAAEERNDEKEADRLIRMLPMDADVMMAFASVCGKEFMIECGFDMTEANMKYGEGWLDELEA